MKKLKIREETADIFKKKEKRINIGEIDIYDLEGDLDAAIALLTEFKNTEVKDIAIEPETSFDGEDGYAVLVFRGTRLETDDEYNLRIKEFSKGELRKVVQDREIKKLKINESSIKI